MKERSFQGALYRRQNPWQNLIHTKFKGRITSEISPTQFSRKTSTVRSASLHKGTNECAPCILKRSTLLHKGINNGEPRILKRQKRALGKRRGSGIHGGQDSTGRDIGPRTSKSSSLPEESDSRILRGYCGAEEFGNLTHFISSPRPTLRRKKCPRTNEKGPKLPGGVAEDNPVLGKPRSRKEGESGIPPRAVS